MSTIVLVQAEIENRLAVLDGDDAARREGASVADAIHVVDDGPGHVARPQKIGVKRVNVALGRHRLHGRR